MSQGRERRLVNERQTMGSQNSDSMQSCQGEEPAAKTESLMRKTDDMRSGCDRDPDAECCDSSRPVLIAASAFS